MSDRDRTPEHPRTPRPIPRRAGLRASFRFAFNGLLRTLCSQRNMKIHWIAGTAVMLVGMALQLDLASRASVLFCVFVVICMEVLNTAVEAFVDLSARGEFAHQAMLAKDAAAGAVLVLALGAAVVLADVLLHRWPMVAESTPAITRTLIAGVPLLAAETAILTMRRRVPALWAVGAGAVALLAFLAYFSRDEVFTVGGLAFIVTAVWARLAEPRLLT